MNILEKLKGLGFDTVPKEFYEQNVDVWQSWYTGKVNSFHKYKFYNGSKFVRLERYSVGMAKKVCEDWANLLMNEKVKITLEGESEQEFFDLVCRDNNFVVKVNEMQERKAALGTGSYVFTVSGVPIDEETGALTGNGESIKIDYVSGRKIIPLSWDNGKIIDCAFAIEKTIKGNNYVYLQIHHKNESGTYDIDNVLYLKNNENLSDVDLKDVAGFENVPPTIHTGSDKRQFVIDRLNIANNSTDGDNPLGVSVYANAIDQLKAIDIAYDSYVTEFVLGKKRIMVKPSVMKSIDGDPAFDTNDVVFYIMPEDSKDESMIHEINMDLRTEQLQTGMQDMLNVLSAKCGFGEQHYKFDRGNVSTATQIVSENSTLFRTIKKHEIILEDVLIEIARTILRLGNTYLGMSLNEDVEISVDFDDSIIEDKATEFARDVQMLGLGILQRYEFRMKWMNEDEETAKAALPQMEALVQDEKGADEV